MASRMDVAKLAGVSPASVSYYINGNGYVGAEASKKIQAAIDTLGYTPNQIARSLKIKDSKQFLFFCNEIRNPFYAELVYKATSSVQKYGYMIMFTSAIDDEELIKKMCSYQISGVFASNNKITSDIMNYIAKRNIPVVMLRDIEWENLDKRITQIKVDYSSIMREISQHLKEQGYKNSMFLSGSKSGESGKVDEKTRNFIIANETTQASVGYKISSTRDAYQFVIENFAKDNCPDSFVCTNDAVALGAMRGIVELGKCVPEVGIVGFDNSLNAQFAVPRLTTVDIRMMEMGDIIVDLLMKKLKGENLRDFLIQPKLIIRESSLKTSH